MRIFTSTAVASGLALVVGVAGPGAAAALPKGYKVEVLYNGSGCKKGDASAEFDDANSVLQVFYPAFVAVIGKKGKMSSRECRIRLRIHSPVKKRYAVTSVYQRGYVDLTQGASATFRSSYGQSSDKDSIVATENWKAENGSYDDVFTVGMEAGADEWSKCGKHENFHIRTKISVVGSSPQHDGSQITVDSTDANVKGRTEYRIRWSDCPKAR